MAVNQITLISLPVSEQERAKTFCVDKLGFQVTADYMMGNAEAGEQEIVGSHSVPREAARLSH